MTAADPPRVGALTGGRRGPVLGLLSGMHADELEGVLAVRIVRGMLAPVSLRGTLRWAAPAHPAAWRTDARTSPDDGLNPARVFLGDPGGTPMCPVAAALTEEPICGCNLLVDLHAVVRGFEMPLLVGHHSTDGRRHLTWCRSPDSQFTSVVVGDPDGRDMVIARRSKVMTTGAARLNRSPVGCSPQARHPRLGGAGGPFRSSLKAKAAFRVARCCRWSAAWPEPLCRTGPKTSTGKE